MIFIDCISRIKRYLYPRHGLQSKIFVREKVILIDGAIKVNDIMKSAKDNYVQNFVVKTESGEDLFIDDFPYEGSIKIVSYHHYHDGIFLCDFVLVKDIKKFIDMRSRLT